MTIDRSAFKAALKERLAAAQAGFVPVPDPDLAGNPDEQARQHEAALKRSEASTGQALALVIEHAAATLVADAVAALPSIAPEALNPAASTDPLTQAAMLAVQAVLELIKE